MITTDSAPIITRASERLTEAFVDSWVGASDSDAGVCWPGRSCGWP